MYSLSVAPLHTWANGCLHRHITRPLPEGKQLLPAFPASTDWGPETLCTQGQEEGSFLQVFIDSFQRDLLRASDYLARWQVPRIQ